MKATSEFLLEYFGPQTDLVLEEGYKTYDLVIQGQVGETNLNEVMKEMFSLGFAHGAVWNNEQPVSNLVGLDGKRIEP